MTAFTICTSIHPPKWVHELILCSSLSNGRLGLDPTKGLPNIFRSALGPFEDFSKDNKKLTKTVVFTLNLLAACEPLKATAWMLLRKQEPAILIWKLHCRGNLLEREGGISSCLFPEHPGSRVQTFGAILFLFAATTIAIHRFSYEL